MGHTDTVALSANEARFFRFGGFFGACSLQNEVGDPHNISLPFCVASFKKICAWELLGVNVFNSVEPNCCTKQITKAIFTTTAEFHARSLAKFYGQYADRHMNLKFVRRVSEREREIRQSVIVKNKLMSVFNASVLLLTMNFVITFSK